MDVVQGLCDFLKQCDQELMDKHLKTVCFKLAETLKQQRGNQYGFGNDPDSDDLDSKNLTEDLMDYGDISTTNPIENLFGNLEKELKNVGSMGFNMAADDLIIKSSKDLIETETFAWHTKRNRKK